MEGEINPVKIVGRVWTPREVLALIRDVILCLFLLIGIVGVWVIVVGISKLGF